MEPNKINSPEFKAFLLVPKTKVEFTKKKKTGSNMQKVVEVEKGGQ